MATTFTWVTPSGDVVALDGTAGVSLLTPVLGLDVPPLTWQLEDRVTFDGAVASRVRAEERPISLPLLVDIDDVSMQDVARMFASVETTGGTVVASTGGQSRTLENVIYEGGLEGEYSGTVGMDGMSWRMVTLRMIALEPWWLGPLQSEVLNSGATTLSDDPAILSDDPDTPSAGGAATQIAVSGDRPSFPIFVIDGPFTTLTLDLPATGHSLELAGALADGDQIVFDTTPGSIGPRLNGGRVDWTLLTAASGAASFLKMLPPSVTVSVSGSGTGANSNVELRWKHRYLTAAA